MGEVRDHRRLGERWMCGVFIRLPYLKKRAVGVAGGSECSRRAAGANGQHSLASKTVRTRVVFDGSAGSSEPNSMAAS